MDFCKAGRGLTPQYRFNIDVSRIMKAILSLARGGPETLEIQTVTDPVAGFGEIVVRIAACGVNYPDSLIIEDRYQFKPVRPFSPGGEFSGVVEEVGPEVRRFRRGDRIMGFCTYGAMAEKLAISETSCAHVPQDMSMTEAAAFLLTYGTSYHALNHRGRLKPGDTLLVLGAAGGIGISSVEIGKAMGARVVAAVSTQEKADFAREAGADETIIYPIAPFHRDTRKAAIEMFKSACGPNGADVICDAVGGDYSEAALRAIAWEGRFLVVGFPAGIPSIPLNLPLLKACEIVGVFWGAWLDRNIEAFHKDVEVLASYYADGALRPRISHVFPMSQVNVAITHLASRRALGKVVVRMEL